MLRDLRTGPRQTENMLRNVALNQLTVIERTALLLLYSLFRWLTLRWPGAVCILRPVAIGGDSGGHWRYDGSVVVIAGVGWICGGLESTACGPLRRCGGGPAGSRWFSIFGRTCRGREPRSTADSFGRASSRRAFLP